MGTGGARACTGSRLGAHLDGGARVIRCCGEKLAAARGRRSRRRPMRRATAMRSAGQHAWTDHCPLPRGEACSPGGNLLMTPEQIRAPALTLYAFIFESGDGAAPKSGRDRCINARQQRGLEPTMAAIICDALTGYVYGRSSRYAYHVTHVREAQVVLHLARGGHESARRHTRPARALRHCRDDRVRAHGRGGQAAVSGE